MQLFLLGFPPDTAKSVSTGKVTRKNKETNAQPALSDAIAKKAIASLSTLVFYFLGIAQLNDWI